MTKMSRSNLVDTISHIHRETEHSACHDRCLVPPHPELFERIKVDLKKLRDGAPPHLRHLIKVKTPSRPGLNDGLVFPGSSFPIGTPVDVVRSSAGARAPLQGTLRVIVVLVEFSDKKFDAAHAQAHFDHLFFSQGALPHGSVREYYTDVTNGLVTITGQVVGPYQLPKKITEYANGASGMGNAAPNARTMARDAVIAANAAVDFAPYDNDGNGYVDAFIVVHAGGGAEQTGSADDIWSHKWVLEGGAYSADGTSIYAYLTVPEDAKIGVCCHELGHLLFGFPDLYDTDQSSSGVGNFCLMGAGSWGGGGDIPTHPSAWCKAQQDWAQVVNHTSNSAVVFDDVKSSHVIHRLWKDGVIGNEYFLVENRQKSGYDATLPGGGLLIWHIDDSIAGNSDDSHPQVKLLEADGAGQLLTGVNRGDAGDVFPGTSNNVSFGDATTPNSKSYGNVKTCVSVTNISAANATMTANVTVKCVTKTKEIGKELKKEQVKELRKEIRKELQKEQAKELRKEVIKERKEVKEFKERKEFKEKDFEKRIDKSAQLDKRIEKPITDKRSGFDKPFDKPREGRSSWTTESAGSAAGPGSVEERLARIEQTLAELEPFIDPSLVPDLSQGAFLGEDDAGQAAALFVEDALRAKAYSDTKPRDR